jgi:AcrR family transcriptional regulator
MLSEMATRRYTAPERARSSAQTVERVLDAAVELVEEDAFHTATMEDLAQRAGVSRATLFTRFGSKLGVLEALSTRCAGGPEMRAIRAALDVEDPVEAIHALVEASANLWETQGYILSQLKAIVVLEPDASALIEEQYDDQRTSTEALVRRAARAGRLAAGWNETRAAAALHAAMSVESFLLLRRDYGLSLARTKETVAALAGAVVA